MSKLATDASGTPLLFLCSAIAWLLVAAADLGPLFNGDPSPPT